MRSYPSGHGDSIRDATMTVANIQFPAWLIGLSFMLCSTLLMLVLERLILRKVQGWVDRSSFRFDTLVLKAIRSPLSIVIIAINLIVLKQVLLYLDVDTAPYDGYFEHGAQLLLIIALLRFADTFTTGAISNYAASSQIRNSQSIIKGIIRGAIYGIGALILLSTVGIPITPLVASLGIGSLAVALALQPTLENFFSGLQLIIDKPIRVGDYIELDSGEQGFVEKIGWRSTWVRMLPNNMVIMPNSALSQSKLINYFYPSKELSVPVEVGVHYDSDLDHVERVTIEVAKDILTHHKWAVPEYDTFVLFHTFDNSSINFTVMLRAQEYANRFFVKSAFIKALHKRFQLEGIVIPFPITALNLSQEQSEQLLSTTNQSPK
ncbi:MAG: mechanosensitive ion channel family protein [Pseudohongiellaceae bacterium]|nr:mechanosensitive ion channel family protein [Pseudohongiellaceae bacterium]